MLSLHLQGILLILATLVIFVKLVLSYTNTHKEPLPSPPALPFIGHLHLFKKPLHHALAHISRTHSPIIFLRFGSRPIVVIASRALAEECFTTHDLALANRPQFPSNIISQRAGSIAGFTSINYNPFLLSVRKICAVELLSAQRLHATSDVRTREVRDMVNRLFKSWKAYTGVTELPNGLKKIELKTSLFQLVLNVMMMMMIAGKRFYGDNIEELEETVRFREAVEQHFTMIGASNIEDFLPVLRFLDLKGVIKHKKHLGKLHKEMVARLIEEQRSSNAESPKTVIARLLELQEKDPEGYTDQKIESICMSIILAGTDTSANTLEWAMASLLNNPEELKKAATEIDEHVGNKRLVEEKDMVHLPYLQCIISEVHRLYPGAPLLVPHESREVVNIGGYKIPRETMILVNAYQIQRDPDMWEEPLKFMPERFADGNAENKWIIPFGMGRRRCPGDGLAMREIGLILGTLIQCFNWQRTGNELVDMTEGSGITLL